MRRRTSASTLRDSPSTTAGCSAICSASTTRRSPRSTTPTPPATNPIWPRTEAEAGPFSDLRAGEDVADARNGADLERCAAGVRQLGADMRDVRLQHGAVVADHA